MLRVLKYLFYLAVLGLIGLTGYAYFGDLSPEVEQVTQPLELDLD